MVKRSPWAAQTRFEKKRARGQFSTVAVTDKFRRANALMTRPVDTISIKEYADFLRANKGPALHMINKIGGNKVNPALFPEFVKAFEEDSTHHDALEALAHSTAEHIVHKDVPEQLNNFGKHMRKYLELRKIPMNKMAFEIALSDVNHDYSRALVQEGNRFNPRLFERAYIKNLKRIRQKELSLNTAVNDVVQRASGGLRLTKNQVVAAKKWVRRTIQDRAQKFREDVLVHATSQAMSIKAIEDFYDQFAHELRTEFLESFFHKSKSTATSATSVVSRTKVGSRAQRLAQYVGVQKEQVAQKTTQRETSLESKTPRKAAFDPVSEVLVNIAKDNAPAANRLSQLVTTQVLSPQSLVRLHDRGSLAQRTFLNAIDSHSFLRYFESKEVNALARMIAFIGPMGKLPSKIKRASQSTRAEALFTFLEKNKLIETGHGGGTVVYLHRPQSKTKV